MTFLASSINLRDLCNRFVYDLEIGIFATGEDHGPVSLQVFRIMLPSGNETLRSSLPQLHCTVIRQKCSIKSEP
jgi:hypothetical protein